MDVCSWRETFRLQGAKKDLGIVHCNCVFSPLSSCGSSLEDWLIQEESCFWFEFTFFPSDKLDFWWFTFQPLCMAHFCDDRHSLSFRVCRSYDVCWTTRWPKRTINTSIEVVRQKGNEDVIFSKTTNTTNSCSPQKTSFTTRLKLIFANLQSDCIWRGK